MPHVPQKVALNFEDTVAPVPYAPGSQTSFIAALELSQAWPRRMAKTRAYILELRTAGGTGLSDQEAAVAIARRLKLPKGMPVHSICSIRNGAIDALLAERAGRVTGDWGKPVQRWRLTEAGQAAAEKLIAWEPPR